MKKLLVLFVLLAMVLPASLFGGGAFGIRMSSSSLLGTLGPANQQGGYFGINSGKATLMVGLDFSRFSTETTEEISVSAISPFFGAKYYFREIDDGDATPYVKLEFLKKFASVKGVASTLLELLGTDLSDSLGISLTDEEQEETESFIEDLFSPWGINIGIGGEYFFSDEFSLGGEFGVKNTFSSATITSGEGVTETSSETKISYTDTYVALTVNFLFK